MIKERPTVFRLRRHLLLRQQNHVFAVVKIATHAVPGSASVFQAHSGAVGKAQYVVTNLN
jgi:hypothetical protein